MNQTNDIQVSVCIVTYNQEKYLAECIEKLVHQQTNFSFEIIIGEDCSTDRTREIVQKYYEQYPNLIVPILHQKNVGALENIRQVYAQAKGKYIAHIDGDDVALAGKIQKQFEALEAHTDCNICSHDMENINQDSNIVKFQRWKYPGGVYSLFDLYHAMPFFAHSSKMFRNNIAKDQWDNLFSDPEILDMDIHFLNLQNGKIIHINENLGQYRINVGMSNTGKKVNPLLPKGAIRIFEKGIIYFKDDKAKVEKLKKLYAYSMLQCAYNYAVYDRDIYLFKDYVRKSFNIKFIGIKQIIFGIAQYMPNIFFNIVKARAKRNGL